MLVQRWPAPGRREQFSPLLFFLLAAARSFRGVRLLGFLRLLLEFSSAAARDVFGRPRAVHAFRDSLVNAQRHGVPLDVVLQVFARRPHAARRSVADVIQKIVQTDDANALLPRLV